MKCRRTPMQGVVNGVIAPPPTFIYGAQYWQGRYRVPRIPIRLRQGTAVSSWGLNYVQSRGLLYHNVNTNTWTVKSG